VRLIKNPSHLVRTVKHLARSATYPADILKRYAKRYLLTHKYDYDNSLESHYYRNFILQQFIPDLRNDWKILIFQDKYYVFEREVREHDFRASGSGKFFYRAFDPTMLDFCERIFEKFKTPWLSLDVCHSSSGFHLLEFQGIHFGPVGLLKAPYYFRKSTENQWQRIDENSDLSTEYAESVVKYLHINSPDWIKK
jgi:hypothetical protein